MHNKKFKRKILALLLANNQGGNLRQGILDGAPFLAELSHTLVLQRGTGSPTYTRATTATVRDHEGVLRTVPAGCARFEGARRVENLLTLTEDFTNVNGGFDANNTNTANSVTFTNANAYRYKRSNSSKAIGTVLVGSAVLSSTDKAVVGLSIVEPSGLATGGFESITLTPTPTRYSVVHTLTVAGQVVLGLDNRVAVGGDNTATGTVTCTDWQLEDITGRTDQTTPSEYVSVGVLSAPYHGAGVDGVKCFNTDLDGNPIPAATNTGYVAEGSRENKCLQSNAFTTTWVAAGGTPTATQNVVGPDGATSAWTVTDNDPANNEAFSTPNILLTAAAYTYSMFVKKTTGVQTSYPCLWFLDAAITTILPCTIDTTNGTATVWTAYTGLAVMSGGSARCTSYNDDYWRVELTGTGTAANWTARFGPALTTNPTQSSGIFDVTAQGSHVFYGAQVELGSFASSYIATTTAAVPRNADVLTYPSSGNVGTDNTFAFTIGQLPSNTAFAPQAFLAYTDGTNRQGCYFDSSGRPVAAGVVGGAVTANITGTTDFRTAGGKVAQVYATNDVREVVNGTAEGTPDNAYTPPSMTTISIGTYGLGATYELYTPIKDFRIWKRALSNSELQAITAP